MSRMKGKYRVDRLVYAVAAICLMLASGGVMAQENDLDVTMRMVVDDEDLSGRVVQELQLPEPAGIRSREGQPGAAGRERAAEARERGRALGREISEEARSNRSELRRGSPDEGIELPSASRPDMGNELPEPGPGSGRDGLPDMDMKPQPDAGNPR
ncbi:hypothetical protein [Marinobacter sp.]|uniref:hypothetical protein n=1 Tax=Marinobacter sp. TaxID=50741 RepID=UPI00384DCAAA